MTYKQAWKDMVEKNERLIDICNMQQAKIKNLQERLSQQESLFKAQEQLLEMYKQENLELKKKPLKNVQDLIEHI